MNRRSILRLAQLVMSSVTLAVVGGCTDRGSSQPGTNSTATGSDRKTVPSAADYEWFDDDDNELVNGFSLTWVKGVSPQEAISRLGGGSLRNVTWSELTEGDILDSVPDGSLCLAATQLSGWTLVVDMTEMLGTTDKLLLPLSRGTTVVSQFLNVELDDAYYLIVNGETRVAFQPYVPDQRSGSAPNELAQAMTLVGFDRRDPDGEQQMPTETAFALTEYLTGIRLTLELIHSQTYLLGSAPNR